MRSRLGERSAFTLVLPRVRRGEPVGGEHRETAVIPRFRGARILIVDDEPWNRDLLRAYLADDVGAFERYFQERRYASSSVGTYLGCLAHFARWMGEHQVSVEELDEDATARILDQHLPHCRCPGPLTLETAVDRFVPPSTD